MLQPIVDRWNLVSEEEKAIYRQPEPFHLDFDDFELLGADADAAPLPLSDFDDGTNRNRLGGTWMFDWKTAPNARFLLTRGRSRSGWAASIVGAREVNDLVLLRMSFQPWGLPFDLTRIRGLRFNVRGDGMFKLRLLQPTIGDFDDYATAAIMASAEWTSVTVPFRELKQAGWGRKLPLTLDAASGIMIEALPHHPNTKRPPSGLFQGMIRPLVPYAIRGVVWYQGESNNARAYQYRHLLPALIRGWRAAWGTDDFPFGIVQLPNYGPPRPEPHGSRWAELREAQLRALAVPQTGLVVTIDQGDPADVHPKHKAEVGKRLALWALGSVYGKDVVYSGPVYDSMRVENGRIRVRFRSGSAGLATRDDGPLKGFSVAGADQVFYWAEARIEGEEVVVASAAVRNPVAVRYAWADSPECTLTNHTGLPASPFRSDDWPAKTMNER